MQDKTLNCVKKQKLEAHLDIIKHVLLSNLGNNMGYREKIMGFGISS